jgi:hypothetical protein
MSLVDIGANGPDGSTNPSLYPSAMRALNLLVKSIDTNGIFTWKITRRTQTLTAGQASYVLAGDAWDIDQPARYVQSGTTTGSQVLPMVRDEYMSLPDRTIQGISYRYYAERSLDASGIAFLTVYLYPVPPTTGDTIELACQLKSQDLTSLAQTLDVDQKALDAIRWNLTLNLAPGFGIGTDQLAFFKTMADEKMKAFVGDDGERGDVQLVPFGQQYNYGYGSWGTGYR